MATSASYNYVINRGDLIQKSAEECGAVEVGGAMPADMSAFFAAQLNMMLKNWHGASLKDLFRLKRTVLLLETEKVKYSLGNASTHDHWILEDNLTETYVNGDQTVSGAATTVTVDSTTGMSAGDYVGVELEDGSIQWTTVASVDSTTTFTPSDSWTDDIDDNDVVYFYTNKAPRPYAIANAWRRSASDPAQSTASDRQGHDTPINVISRDRYINYGQKRSEGVVSNVYYDPQIGTDPSNPAGELFIYSEPTDVSQTLRFYAVFPFDDMDADADDFSCPQHWYLPIMLGLAKRGFNAYGTPTALKQEVKEQFAEAWLNAISARNIGGSVQFVPYAE